MAQGRETIAELPPIKINGPAMVKVWTLSRQVKLADKAYSVKELCELLTAKTDSNPRIVAAPSIEDEKVTFTGGEMQIWDVLEQLFRDRKWKVTEGVDATLVLGPN